MTSAESTGLFVLNPDVEIVSVREFPNDIRDRLGGNASDFVVSDRTSRIGSQRIDQEAAIFLRRFRYPRRIVEAVIDHSADLQRDPAQVLNEIHPLVTTMRRSAILVDPVAASRRALGRALTPGELFEGYRILEGASRLAETEVYKAESADGSLVAVKYLRAGSDESVRANLRREIQALEKTMRKGCAFTPRLYSARPDRDDPFVCAEWFDGQTLFDLIRARRYGLSDRARIVDSLLEAYAGLHGSGVLHGDVHPSNVLVLDDGRVRLIDFGGSRLMDTEHRDPRIGLVQFYEPEVAQAVLAGQTPPAPTLSGEQYCVAGLAYSTIVGGAPLLLSLETESALKQIASQRPRLFDELGVTWPVVEKVLGRALSKVPSDRFATFSDFRDALAQALATTIPPQQPRVALAVGSPGVAASRSKLLGQCVRGFTERHGLAANLTRVALLRGPTASLYAGAAGIAYALLRVGCLRRDPATVAAADVWISRALRERNDAMAFTDGSSGADTATGPLALFHSETGLHATNALIRYVSGDKTETREALTAFVQSVPAEALDHTSQASLLTSFPQDATNGASSLLLGSALLLPLCKPDDVDIQLRLEALAQQLCGIVQRQLESPAQGENRLLGFAHGRTGALYSLLRWAEVAQTAVAPPVSQYLDELASFASRCGTGLAWPIDMANASSPHWTGWCHGSAGHLLTWTTAARVLGRSEYMELALAAGRHISGLEGHSGPSLCCGGAGEALSLFELARGCGDNMWVDRGMRLATFAVETAHYTHDAQGLFRAEVGIALTAMESIEPGTSAWPICQSPL